MSSQQPQTTTILTSDGYYAVTVQKIGQAAPLPASTNAYLNCTFSSIENDSSDTDSNMAEYDYEETQEF